jgi:RNase P subunit RPR2
MAMNDLVTSRFTYLQEAAHLLAVSSPSASAFLGLARNRLVEDTGTEVPTREWDALRRETCGACGNMLIPGWSCEVSNEHQTRAKSGKRKSIPSGLATSNTSVVYHCHRCHRKTEQLLQPPARRQVNKLANRIVSNPSIAAISKPVKEDDPKVLKTANSSSKQRQRARKGGLQAMLEKNKTQSLSQGLDLMDFAM